MPAPSFAADQDDPQTQALARALFIEQMMTGLSREDAEQAWLVSGAHPIFYAKAARVRTSLPADVPETSPRRPSPQDALGTFRRDAIGPLGDQQPHPGPFALLVRDWDVEDGQTVLVGPIPTFEQAINVGNRTSAPSAIVMALHSLTEYGYEDEVAP